MSIKNQVGNAKSSISTEEITIERIKESLDEFCKVTPKYDDTGIFSAYTEWKRRIASYALGVSQKELLRPLPREFGKSLLEENFKFISMVLTHRTIFHPTWYVIEDKDTYQDGTSKCTALMLEGPKSVALVRR